MPIHAEYVLIDAVEEEKFARNPKELIDSLYAERSTPRSVENRKSTEQVLVSGSEEEKLDLICRFYAHAFRRWEACDKPREFCGLTEDQLITEASRRGYRFWLDLDEDWDTLHQLLTGGTVEHQSLLRRVYARIKSLGNILLSQAILGGDLILDIPNHQVRYLKPGQAEKIARALQMVSIDQLTANFDLVLDFDPTEVNSKIEQFHQLRKFYSKAQHFRNGVIVSFRHLAGPQLGRCRTCH